MQLKKAKTTKKRMGCRYDSPSFYKTNKTMISTCKSNEKIILCNGFTCVKEGEYYGVKNTNGQWVVKPIYDEIMYMEEDLIAAKKDGWYGFAHLDNPPSEINLKFEIETEPDD